MDDGEIRGDSKHAFNVDADLEIEAPENSGLFVGGIPSFNHQAFISR